MLNISWVVFVCRSYSDVLLFNVILHKLVILNSQLGNIFAVFNILSNSFILFILFILSDRCACYFQSPENHHHIYDKSTPIMERNDCGRFNLLWIRIILLKKKGLIGVWNSVDIYIYNVYIKPFCKAREELKAVQYHIKRYFHIAKSFKPSWFS